MAKQGKKQEDTAVEVEGTFDEPAGEEKTTGKRPKRVTAHQGRKRRIGANRRPRTVDLLVLLDEDAREDIEFE